MDKMLLIDGHNLLFRMFYGIPSSIMNSDDEDIKAVVGFIASINKLMKKFRTRNIIIVFDSETSTQSRLEEFEEYKQNRIDYSQVPDEENPFTQLPHIYKALSYLNVEYYEATICEADDYIASLSDRYRAEFDVVIVSTDKDFLQLVDDKTTVYNPVGKEGTLYTSEKVYEKFLVSPKQIIDYKILVGDPSDNITGVKGIGKKTAAKILSSGSIMDILNGDVEIEEKWLNKLHEHKSIIERNRKLITMDRKIELNDHEGFAVDLNTERRTMDILRDCGVMY